MIKQKSPTPLVPGGSSFLYLRLMLSLWELACRGDEPLR
ncbi:hypothetical protein SAMN02745903_00205 [Pseudomonas sp. URMO17WK12:I5]|nr:hypothetical protein H040_00205 [Pseudomonas sp. URMO17WK12:I7]SME91009.1 hypothetical protein SAMN02745903_00205 [Pseudomonas sp. URMO17WK12:I5]